MYTTSIGDQRLLPGFVADVTRRRPVILWAARLAANHVLRGGTWAEAAELVGIEAGTLRRLTIAWEPSLARRRPRIRQAVRCAIMADMSTSNDSLRTIAARYGVCPESVRIITATGIPQEDRPEPKRKNPRRCPECGGLMATVRCLVCLARKRREAERQKASTT